MGDERKEITYIAQICYYFYTFLFAFLKNIGYFLLPLFFLTKKVNESM